MAKKKSARSAKEPKQIPIPQEESSDSEQPKSAIDGDSVEKSQLQSLKELNGLLVKETHEKRKEVGALVRSKEALELDLKRNVDEKEQVLGELSEACDGVYGLELERNVVCVYLQSRMEEMGGGICGLIESGRVKDVEIGRLKDEVNGFVLKVEEEREKWRRVCCERDEIKVDFDGLFEETGDLRGKVVEMERNERRALEEIEDFKGKCKKLLGEKRESENLYVTLMKENELVKKKLDESSRVIGDLEMKVDVKMKEKVKIEKEKKGLDMEIEKLVKQVAQLNESSFCFKQEKEENGKKISELERRIEEAVWKENGMVMEVDGLVKELKKMEKDIEMLTQQRDSLELNLNTVQEEAESLRRMVEVITREKVEMEEAEMEAENVIGELQRELNKLKEAITSLTELSDVEKARNGELLSEINRLRDALEGERVDARKSFDDERKSVEKLSLLLEDKERRIEEALTELEKVKLAQEDSFNVKKEMEKRIEILVREMDGARKSFNDEKESVKNLSLLLEDKERRIEVALNELEKVKLAQEDSFNGKKEMEKRINILVEERDSMEKNLLEAQSRIDELKVKVKSAVSISEKALELLKKTCLVVCDGYEKKGEVEASSEEKIVEVQDLLDAIKTSFTNKEKVVEEMKRCLETERVEQRKKKSFFTIVTAATTILAAISAVYVSKGR